MRALNATDAKDMASLHAESFERSWDALEMATHTQRDLCYGIEAEGQLAAFTIISLAAAQTEILTIATAKAARRQGWGRKLLEATVMELKEKGASELFLEVAEDNPAAIALYKSTGFSPIGRRPGYYRRAKGRVAAITFSKKL